MRCLSSDARLRSSGNHIQQAIDALSREDAEALRVRAGTGFDDVNCIAFLLGSRDYAADDARSKRRPQVLDQGGNGIVAAGGERTGGVTGDIVELATGFEDTLFGLRADIGGDR